MFVDQSSSRRLEKVGEEVRALLYGPPQQQQQHCSGAAADDDNSS